MSQTTKSTAKQRVTIRSLLNSIDTGGVKFSISIQERLLQWQDLLVAHVGAIVAFMYVVTVAVFIASPGGTIASFQSLLRVCAVCGVITLIMLFSLGAALRISRFVLAMLTPWIIVMSWATLLGGAVWVLYFGHRLLLT